MASYRFPDSEIPMINEEFSPLLNRLLHNRGFTDIDEAKLFLKPDYDTQLHDAGLLNDIDKAVDRIQSAVSSEERIAIFSDYDCDGIPGAVVLHDLFKAIKYENFTNYIPHRHYEGFGLSKEAIDKLAKEKVSLIITIDCGTNNVEEVAYAKEKGIDVIVTDHHEPDEALPKAVAIVNPKLGDYPFPDLCGAAVAFKLAQAVLATGQYEVVSGWEKWWLDMVGIATIADMVPLRGENRVLAYYGLQVLRKSRRPGLQQLLKKARVNQLFLTEEDIGFTIGPRINAASRMDNPEDAFYMLAEKNLVEAGARVEHLEKLNQERKTQVALMTKDLHKRLKALEEIPKVLVLGHTEWRPSLVGLAANKLAEEYSRPVFLWGTDGNGVYKGSCRSGGNASVVKLMQAVTDVFIEHGGHHASGGFSVKDEHIFDFGEKLNEAMVKLGHDADIDEEISIDAEINLSEVNDLLINDLKTLSPFGVGNQQPIFVIKKIKPSSVAMFGKTNEHCKLILSEDDKKLEAIAFFKRPEQFTKEPKSNMPCDLIVHVEESFFMGRKQTRLRIIDII